MCTQTELLDGHSDVICTNQQEAVITSSPSRIFQTSIGTISKKKPLILLIWAWLHCLLALRKQVRRFHSQGCPCFLSMRKRKTEIKSLSPRNSASLPIVLWLSQLLRVECLVWVTHMIISSLAYSVLSDEIITAFYCFTSAWQTWTQMLFAFCLRMFFQPMQRIIHPGPPTQGSHYAYPYWCLKKMFLLIL